MSADARRGERVDPGPAARDRSGHISDRTGGASRLDAYAVLLPAVVDLRLPAWLRTALASGTQGFILGEDRDEYVARRMSERRRADETPDQMAAVLDEARRLAGGELLVAVDHEPWGTRRLQHLTSQLPEIDATTSPDELRRAAHEFAAAARGLGVTAVLSPVLDRLTGPNPWLTGRTLDASSAEIGRLAAAFVDGVQAGGLVCFAKHFPGFPHVTADPAEALAHVPAGAWSDEQLAPFAACVEAGTVGVMTGPAPVTDLDPDQPASTSSLVVSMLRRQLGFTGLILSDDLDAPATTLGRSVPETAVAAVRAGVDLLLMAGGDEVARVVDALVATADGDPVFADALRVSADRVRAAARRPRTTG